METQERTPVLTGREGAEIDIKVAKDWTKNQRERNPGGVVSQFFGREILEKILDQSDCVGLRFYYANSKPASGWQRFVTKLFPRSEGEVHLIIAGVNHFGQDQLPDSGTHVEAFALKTATATSGGSTSGTLGEQSVPCPGGVGCPQSSL
ncbi:MAG TPA: hypothetical protein VL442_19985 [Mucilaginibacter sp.]|nr:hypothetical protein [Mucilaginibacter sp.]